MLVVGGSVEVPGAALLAAIAALRAGAGKLQIATCRSIATQLGLAVPEALVLGLPETRIWRDRSKRRCPAARADRAL